MRALLRDSAVLQHDQPVHGRDGRQAVRDSDHRLAAHELIEAVLDCGLDLRIKRRGGLIQGEDRGWP